MWCFILFFSEVIWWFKLIMKALLLQIHSLHNAALYTVTELPESAK